MSFLRFHSPAFRLRRGLALALAAVATLPLFTASSFTTQPAPANNPSSSATLRGFLGVEITYAQQAPQTQATPPKDTAKDFAEFLNGFIQFLYMILSPALMLTSWLLTPDWTYGDAFGLRPILHQLWVMVSNVVYIIFAIMLVVVAFMNVFGGKNYEVKSVLPKFIGGIILVPLSWFLVSAILSFGNVLTAAVLALPYDMIMSQSSLNGAKSKLEEIKVPNRCTIDLAAKSTSGGVSGASAFNNNTKATGFVCNEPSVTLTKLLQGQGAYSLLTVYAYGIFRIQEMKNITEFNVKTLKDVSDVGLHLSLSIIFFVVFALLVIAILLALLTRAFYLWMYIIFSPVLGLVFFGVDNKGWFLKEALGKVKTGDFIALAFVPAYVSAALAFGMLFITLTMGATQDTAAGQNSYFKFLGKGSSADTQIVTFGGADNSLFTLELKGIPTGYEGITPSSAGGLGLGFIGQIIINFIAIAVLWMGVMAALKSSSITAKAAQPIISFGESLGKLAMELPKYTPIPLPGGGTISPHGLANIPEVFRSKISSDASKAGNELGQRLFGSNNGTKLSSALNDDEELKRLSRQAGTTRNMPDLQNAGQRLFGVVSESGMKLDDVLVDDSLRTAFDKKLAALLAGSDTTKQAKIATELNGAKTKEQLADAIADGFKKIGLDSDTDVQNAIRWVFGYSAPGEALGNQDKVLAQMQKLLDNPSRGKRTTP